MQNYKLIFDLPHETPRFFMVTILVFFFGYYLEVYQIFCNFTSD